MTTKVFLVGYMGCGKSTLARKLSRRTGVRAVDTDAEVERMEGGVGRRHLPLRGRGALPRTGTFGGGARGGFRRGLHRRHGRRPAHVERQYGDAVEGGYDGLSAPFGGADRRAADALRTGETPPNCRGSAMPSWWSSCGATSPSANPTTRRRRSCSTATR